MSMMAGAQAFLKVAINPSTYTEAFSKGFNYIQKEYIAKGKMGATVTGFMLCVGTGGYLIEYMTVGRYHVAHKKHKIEAALKEYDEKHGSDGHH